MVDFTIEQRLYASDLRILGCRRDVSIACDRVSVRVNRTVYHLCRKRVSAFFVATDGMSLAGIVCDPVERV